MSSWQTELLVEQHRREILDEITQINLEKEAEQAGTIYHSTWFTRSMERFGTWLILIGEGLVHRYKAPPSQPYKPGYASS